MKRSSFVLALAFVALPLAGCVDPEQESAEPGGHNAAGFALSTADLSRIRIDVVTNGTANARFLVEVEREDGSNVAETTMDVRETRNRTVESETGGANALWVLVTLTEGSSARVHVLATGIAADGTEHRLREETFDLRQ